MDFLNTQNTQTNTYKERSLQINEGEAHQIKVLPLSFFELLAMSKCQTSPQLREVCDRNCGGKKHCAECLSEHDLLPTHCFLPVSCHCSACSQPTLCPLLLRLLITEKTGKKVIFLSFFSEKITVSWRVNLNATERRRKSTPQRPYRKRGFFPRAHHRPECFLIRFCKECHVCCYCLG